MIKANYNSAINCIVDLIHTQKVGGAYLKRVNTGSNVYTIKISYNPHAIGLFYEVEKQTSQGRFIGEVSITKVSEYGCEYNNTVIGSLPDSVVKIIKKSYVDIKRQIKSYSKKEGTVKSDR